MIPTALIAGAAVRRRSGGAVIISGETFLEGSDIDLLADEAFVGAGLSVEFFRNAESVGTDASGPPWTETDEAVTPGTKAYTIEVDGGDPSPATVVTVDPQAPTLTEPDGGEDITIGATFTLTATTFNDAVTTDVDFRVTGPSSYDATFAGVLDTGVWEYDWDTTGLAEGTYTIRAIRSGTWGSVESATADVDLAVVTTPSVIDAVIDNPATVTNTRTPTTAASLQANDILVAYAYSRVTGTNAVTPPAGEGWTDDTGLGQTVSGVTEKVFWKRWGSGDTDDASPTFTLGASGAGWAVAMMVVRGCKTTGSPFTITPAGAVRSSDLTPDSAVVGSAPGANTLTLWSWQFRDDNTPANNTRGTMPIAVNVSNTGALALVWEQGVDSSTVQCSVEETVNGTDNCAVFTIVLEPAA